MRRFAAETLDLSRFPAPLALRGVDFEALLAASINKFKAIWAALRADNPDLPDYDGELLESDPAMILLEAGAYRAALKAAEINDALKAVMVAFAVGSDLDHMAAFYGVQRLIVGYEATGNKAPIYENDAQFRRRVLLAPEAFSSAGAPGGYIFHALTASGQVLNVDVWSPGGRDAVIAVQARSDDGVPSAELVETVRAYLLQKHVKPLTDVVTVQPITLHTFDVDLIAYVLPGPDPVAVKDAIVAAIQKVAAARRTPARDMPRSALIAAAQLDVVDKVTLTSPAADIARGYGEVAALGSLNVTVETYNG